MISVNFSFQCSFFVLYDTASFLELVASSFNLSFSLWRLCSFFSHELLTRRSCCCGTRLCLLLRSEKIIAWHGKCLKLEFLVCTWNFLLSFDCDIFCPRICQGPVVLDVMKLSALVSSLNKYWILPVSIVASGIISHQSGRVIIHTFGISVFL